MIQFHPNLATGRFAFVLNSPSRPEHESVSLSYLKLAYTGGWRNRALDVRPHRSTIGAF
jgi:hypothetical protein